MSLDRESRIVFDRLCREHTPRAEASLEEARALSARLVDRTRTAGMIGILEQEPMASFLAAHGGALVDAAGPPWSLTDMRSVETATGYDLPPSMRRCLDEGGFMAYRRDPRMVLRTLDCAAMMVALARVRDVFERDPEHAPRDPDDDTIRGSAGVYEAIESGDVDLLPLADHGNDFMSVVALSVRDDGRECPIVLVSLAERSAGELYRNLGAWKLHHTRIAHLEIGG